LANEWRCQKYGKQGKKNVLTSSGSDFQGPIQPTDERKKCKDELPVSNWIIAHEGLSVEENYQ
jgi:hypothetical protein